MVVFRHGGSDDVGGAGVWHCAGVGLGDVCICI